MNKTSEVSANEPKLPSNSSFGVLFVFVFSVVTAYAWWKTVWWVGFPAVAAGLTLGVTLVTPSWLTPFNRLWMKFAELLHMVVSPIVLGAIFFVIFTPVGLVMRLAGRDALRRKVEPQLKSYWLERDTSQAAADDFRNQF